MKHLIYILVLFTGFISSSQNEILMEHIWELEYIELDGETLYQPENEESDNAISLQFANNLLQSNLICNSFLADSFNVIDENTFAATLFSDTLADCIIQENRDFEANYKSVFFTPNLVDFSPFNYSFSTEEDIIYLTITNSDGNSATYSATTLSDTDFKDISFSIYPNPVAKNLHIKSQQSIYQIEVFNLNGKRILNEAYQENQAIDVSGLPSGLYILKIETEKGSVTKKLVKE